MIQGVNWWQLLKKKSDHKIKSNALIYINKIIIFKVRNGTVKPERETTGENQSVVKPVVKPEGDQH